MAMQEVVDIFVQQCGARFHWGKAGWPEHFPCFDVSRLVSSSRLAPCCCGTVLISGLQSTWTVADSLILTLRLPCWVLWCPEYHCELPFGEVILMSRSQICLWTCRVLQCSQKPGAILGAQCRYAAPSSGMQILGRPCLSRCITETALTQRSMQSVLAGLQQQV